MARCMCENPACPYCGTGADTCSVCGQVDCADKKCHDRMRRQYEEMADYYEFSRRLAEEWRRAT